MKVINLFGQPSAGKSTLAAGTFFKMKQMGINVELVTEFAKDITWEESFKTLDNQLYILSNQHHRQFRLKDKVDYLVTDSPLLLSLHYGQNQSPIFHKMVLECFNEFDNINFFIERGSRPYSTVGRRQTEEEADVIGQNIKNILKLKQIPYSTIVRSGIDDVDIIIRGVLGSSGFGCNGGTCSI